MTTQATTPSAFSSDDISALFAPPLRRPTSQEIFEISRAQLADAKLAPIEMFDSFARRLPADSIPFLLLPPQPAALGEMDWRELMARIQLNGQTGKIDLLNVSILTDLDPLVSVPRMLVGIEDGRAWLKTRPSVAQVGITATGRFGYGLWMGFIHLMVYTEVLNHHNMNLIRSRYNSGYDEDVPYLSLCNDVPVLRARWDVYADPEWGAPSFGSVIEI